MDADRSETVHSLPLNIQPSNSLSLSLSLSSIVTSEDVSRRFFLNREEAPTLSPRPRFSRPRKSLEALAFRLRISRGPRAHNLRPRELFSGQFGSVKERSQAPLYVATPATLSSLGSCEFSSPVPPPLPGGGGLL